MGGEGGGERADKVARVVSKKEITCVDSDRSPGIGKAHTRLRRKEGS